VDTRPCIESSTRSSRWMGNRLGWLWSAIVIAVSIAPPGIKTYLRPTGPLHAWAHLAMFCAGALVVCRTGGRPRDWARLVPCLVATAFLSEMSEVAIYRNAFEYADVAADLAGVLVGLGFLWFWRSSFPLG
jgi:hypothetical protein